MILSHVDTFACPALQEHALFSQYSKRLRQYAWTSRTLGEWDGWSWGAGDIGGVGYRGDTEYVFETYQKLNNLRIDLATASTTHHCLFVIGGRGIIHTG